MGRATELLVVEDEPLIRLLLTEELREQGFIVHEAENAVEALTLLSRTFDISAVITDVIMPGDLTGLDLANWVAEHRPGTPVIVTSGYVSDRQALLGSKAFHSFIRKPYLPEAVVQAVALHLSKPSN